ncbi:MAG: histidinol-phosphatase HisJ family protein [Bacillota bacterium]
MSSDFHTHTHCSPDSSTPVAKVLEVALQRGLHAIAITDHAEIDPTGFGFVSPHCRSYEAYRQAVLEAAAAYEGRLKILLGVEVGYRMEYDALVRRFLGAHEFDVVIGSIHDSPPVDWWDPRSGELLKRDPEKGVQALVWYFTELLGAARSGMFDIIAHVDVYERYLPGMWPDPFSHPTVAPLARKAVQAIAEHSRMEINLAMLNRDGHFAWSSLRFLEMYREMGGRPPVVGSDAHRPSWVGLNIKEGEELARKAGFRGTAPWEEVVSGKRK